MTGTPEILWRDEAIVAAGKPSGLLTIPGRRPGGTSLHAELERHLGERLFIVHRLDQGTSGIVLFARTAEAHRGLSLAFERRQVEKVYRALVSPSPIATEGEIVQELVSARRGFVRLARPGETGQRAVTRWRRVAVRADGALLELRPLTGRTHQLRIALAEEGMPIAGEPHYRSSAGLRAATAPRLWLHAERIAFDHPTTGERLELLAPPPPELR
ncbi:MAG: RluA family pseudouridine synthase [Deltaproteobacteria bacterium]